MQVDRIGAILMWCSRNERVVATGPLLPYLMDSSNFQISNLRCLVH